MQTIELQTQLIAEVKQSQKQFLKLTLAIQLNYPSSHR